MLARKTKADTHKEEREREKKKLTREPFRKKWPVADQELVLRVCVFFCRACLQSGHLILDERMEVANRCGGGRDV